MSAKIENRIGFRSLAKISGWDFGTLRAQAPHALACTVATFQNIYLYGIKITSEVHIEAFFESGRC